MKGVSMENVVPFAHREGLPWTCWWCIMRLCWTDFVVTASAFVVNKSLMAVSCAFKLEITK